MRFGGKFCGKCFREKAFWQRDSTYYWMIAILLVIVVAVFFGQ